MHQKQNPAGFYTKGEEIFNAVSHGAGSVLAIGGTGALVALAAALANWRTVLICLVYGLSLVVLYTMSTLYHAFPFEGVKRLFRVFDHSSIYLLIAGSYTPFTLILLDGTWKGPVICGVVWAAALLGVTLNAVSVERFEKFSMLLYIAMVGRCICSGGCGTRTAVRRILASAAGRRKLYGRHRILRLA